MNIYRKFFVVALTQILIFFSLPPQSLAFDSTDTSPPTYTIEKIDVSSGDVLAFKITASDSSNNIRIQLSNDTSLGDRYFEFDGYLGNKVNLAPACSVPTSIMGFVGDDQANRSQMQFQSRTKVFTLVLVPKTPDFPDSCPKANLILGVGAAIPLVISDEAGNKKQISLSQNVFEFSRLEINNRLCFALDSQRVKALDLIVTFYAKIEKSLETGLKDYPNYTTDFDSLREKYISSQNYYLSIVNKYLSFLNESFNLNSFINLPRCKYVNNSWPVNIATDIANSNFYSEYNEVLDKARNAAEKAAAEKAAAEKAATIKKLSTINCVKGKITKRITAVNPKCPAGYKKK